MKLTITVIRDQIGEWEAMYCNDEIYEESHELTIRDVAKCIEEHNMKSDDVVFVFKTVNNNKYFYDLKGDDEYKAWNTKQYLSEYEEDDFIQEEEN